MIDVHIYTADLIRAKDGDTVVLLVDQGFGDYKKTTFRLTDYDAPETYRPSCSAEREHGNQATARLLELIQEQVVEKPITFMQKHYELMGIDLPNTGLVIRSTKRGKYRWLAELYPLSALQGDSIDESLSFNTILDSEGLSKLEFYKVDEE